MRCNLGEHCREIEGENMFFCCNICADIFENMVNEVKKRTGWEKIGHIQLIGNYSKGRECKATSGNESYNYYFRTYGDGRMMAFQGR